MHIRLCIQGQIVSKSAPTLAQSVGASWQSKPHPFEVTLLQLELQQSYQLQHKPSLPRPPYHRRHNDHLLTTMSTSLEALRFLKRNTLSQLALLVCILLASIGGGWDQRLPNQTKQMRQHLRRLLLQPVPDPSLVKPRNHETSGLSGLSLGFSRN